MTTIGERNKEISEHYMTYIVGGQKGLITQAEYKKLLANYEANKGKEDTTDFKRRTKTPTQNPSPYPKSLPSLPLRTKNKNPFESRFFGRTSSPTIE